MNTDQKLLVACIELIAKAATRNGFSGRTIACMVLDKAGADMADNASPSEREEIFHAMHAVRRRVLNGPQFDNPLLQEVD